MAWVEQRGTSYRVRYRRDDGTVATDSAHPTKSAARARAADMTTDQRRDQFIDPAAGKITLGEWASIWADAHDVSAGTWAKYQSYLTNHILPRFADTPLTAITRMSVKAWLKQLRHGRRPATVAGIVGLLSTILGEAVEDRRLTTNPCRSLRLAARDQPERPRATPAEVLAIAERAPSPTSP